MKGHVRGVKGVNHCTVLPINDQWLCMLEVSKVVFVAFTQHCIQNNVTHVGGVKGLLCIQWPLTPPRGKAIWKTLHLVGLAVHHQSVWGGSFANFLDLSTTLVIAGKMHSQSPILKLTKGVLSNLVILTYLWEQSCILHTLTKQPA